MDYFEATIARILEEEGYWVRENVRVSLEKNVRKALAKASLPRVEIDIVAYKPQSNELVLFEVKSYLDSKGVQPKDLLRTDWDGKNRYKLLTLPLLQAQMTHALLKDYVKEGLVRDDVQVRFGLAAGHILPANDAKVRAIAAQRGWEFRGPAEIAEAIWKFADSGYENSPFVITAKILRRHRASAESKKRAKRD